MREFPSCFGENGVQVADSSSSSSNPTKSAQNVVTCVYQCQLRGRFLLVTVTWYKNLISQGVSVSIDDIMNQCFCKVDIKPWLFSKKKGFKSLDVNSDKIEMYWDLSTARFGHGPEPLEGFYLAVLFNSEVLLVLGDKQKEACKKIDNVMDNCNSAFVAKREHVFGKKSFAAKAQFRDKGQIHDVRIECDTNDAKDPCLLVRIDSKIVMQVKRLKWKFRGNHTIVVDGIPVEVFWDVHDWLFGTCTSNAVFMFQTCLSVEKLWDGESVFDTSVLTGLNSRKFGEFRERDVGFSLTLYAWKNE